MHWIIWLGHFRVDHYHDCETNSGSCIFFGGQQICAETIENSSYLATADDRMKLFGATKMHESKIATTSRQNNVTKIATKIKPWKRAQVGFLNSVSTLKGFNGLTPGSKLGFVLWSPAFFSHEFLCKWFWLHVLLDFHRAGPHKICSVILGAPHFCNRLYMSVRISIA